MLGFTPAGVFTVPSTLASLKRLSSLGVRVLTGVAAEHILAATEDARVGVAVDGQLAGQDLEVSEHFQDRSTRRLSAVACARLPRHLAATEIDDPCVLRRWHTLRTPACRDGLARARGHLSTAAGQRCPLGVAETVRPALKPTGGILSAPSWPDEAHAITVIDGKRGSVTRGACARRVLPEAHGDIARRDHGIARNRRRADDARRAWRLTLPATRHAAQRDRETYAPANLRPHRRTHRTMSVVPPSSPSV